MIRIGTLTTTVADDGTIAVAVMSTWLESDSEEVMLRQNAC